MTPTIIVKRPWLVLDERGRKTTMIQTDAGTFTIKQLSVALAIPRGTIRSRLDRYNWSHPYILSKEKIQYGGEGGEGGDVDDGESPDNPPKRDPESIKFGFYEVAVFGKRLHDTKSFKKMIAERDMEYRRQLFATIGR